MVTFYPLSSGSSGNSYYLSAGEGQGSLLIDAGISARRIRTELCDAGIDPAGLRGILITHDHADHVAGLRVLAKQLKLPVYATAGTLDPPSPAGGDTGGGRNAGAALRHPT